MRPANNGSRCRECGEDWPDALHKESGLCRNHAVLQVVSHEPHAKIVAHCPVCGRAKVPAQWHHIAGERQHKHLRVLLCLNCHGIITVRQCTGWDPSWQTERHPIRCICQGTYDLLWLWWHRSGVYWWRWQLSELAHMVRLAFLALLDVWGFRGWDMAI